MKFLPVSFAIVSITTLSSALLKSSCTSSPPLAVGRSAGGPAAGAGWPEATPAPSWAASRAAARAGDGTRSRGGRGGGGGPPRRGGGGGGPPRGGGGRRGEQGGASDHASNPPEVCDPRAHL